MTTRNQAGQPNVRPRQSRLPRWLQIVLIGRNPKVTLVRVTVLAVTCFVVFRFILLPARIEGISMLPTYKDRSVNLVNRLAYRWHEPRRGDVVGIRLAGPHVMYMKRIIGLPGETVAFVNGRVLINGEVLDEPYEKRPVTGTVRRSGSARTSISSSGTTAPCLRTITCLEKPGVTVLLAKLFYENYHPHCVAGRAGGAGRLAVDGAFSQPGKGHSPASHGTGPHRFVFAQ